MQANTPDNYDLSFVYKFAWEQPTSQIREALRLLTSALEQDGDCSINDLRVGNIIARHPETPPPVLDRLADSGVHPVIKRIAGNEKTSKSTLERLAIADCRKIRKAVADNRNTPAHILAQLALDEDVEVRYTVADNYNAPVELLQQLSEDDNPFVADRAQRTMERLSQESSVKRKIGRLAGRIRNGIKRLSNG